MTDRPLVLIVEDDGFLLAALASALKAAGFDVIEARDAPEALDLIRLRGKAVQWLVTDYQLGLVSGIHVAFEFRFQHPTRPIVFITARELPDDMKRMSGVIYLPKPFLPGALVSLMETLRANEADGRIECGAPPTGKGAAPAPANSN